jgi:hypothetical protein
MYLFGIFNTIGFIVCFFITPSILNKSVSEEKIEELLSNLELVEDIEKELHKKEKKITIKSLFINRHSLFAMILCFVGATYSSFFEAFLSVTLSDRGMNPNLVGYIFGIDCFVFGICSVIYSYSCIKFPRKSIFIMGLLLAGITFFLMGPSLILGFPNKNMYTVISFFPLGLL